MTPPRRTDPAAGRTTASIAGARITAAVAAILLLAVAVSGRVPPAAGHGRPAPDMRVDPGRDPVAVLDALPGVGPSTAAAMQDAARRDPPRIGRDLRRAAGIGPRTAARLSRHVRLPRLPSVPPTPAATRRLPG